MMSLMRQSIMLALALFAIGPISHGIGQMAGYFPKGGPDIPAEDVSVIQLIANPQAYDGKTVRITGFLHLEFEGNVIYLHSEDFRYGLTKNGLWVEIPKDMSKEQIKAVNDQYVICTAKFVARMHGHMGMNSGDLANVTRLEVWSPTPRPITK